MFYRKLITLKLNQKQK